MESLKNSLQKISPEALTNSTDSKSLTKYNDHYTREQLLSYREENIRVTPDSSLLKSVYHLHELLGATGALPTDPDEKNQTAKRKRYMEDWLKFLFIENDRSPVYIPIGFLLAEFANGLVSGNFQRKGNNVAAFAECYLKSVPTLIKKWEKHNKPKEEVLRLEESEMDRLCKGDCSNWPDDAIKDQYEKMDKIYEGDVPDSFESYYQKIETEIINRGLQ